VAFELLTGERPFKAENFAAQARAHVEDPPPKASEVNADLPESVDAVLDRGLAKDADRRWPTSMAFVDALEDALQTPSPPPTAPTRRVAQAADGAPPSSPPRRYTSAPPPRPRRGGVLLAALALVAAAAVVAAIALAGGGGGNDGTHAQGTPTPKATHTPAHKKTPTPTATSTPTPTATQTSTPTPSPTSTPGGGGKSNLDQARQLQVAGYNARRNGDYQKDLDLSQQALAACGNAHEMDPCGYALFEKGLALNRLGRPDEAIPVLQQRLDQYGDNEKGEVSKELKDAQHKAGKAGKPGKAPKPGKGPKD
jgi:eukaryotic-like serine/threonine-protein kinase